MNGSIQPAWSAPANVRAMITTRTGGISSEAYGGMNIGLASGDDIAHVIANRAQLRASLPADPRWLNQVHGATVVDAALVNANAPPVADASFTDAPNVVCTVSIADCMPVLLSDTSGLCVGVAHAGWRGLASGVIQATVHAMRKRIGNANAEMLAYLGPAIGPSHFEVSIEVLEAMQARLPDAERAFAPHSDGKYLADLFELGRQALDQVGVESVYGGHDCTLSDPARFYSFRRDKKTGRHAALIWRV